MSSTMANATAASVPTAYSAVVIPASRSLRTTVQRPVDQPTFLRSNDFDIPTPSAGDSIRHRGTGRAVRAGPRPPPVDGGKCSSRPVEDPSPHRPVPVGVPLSAYPATGGDDLRDHGEMDPSRLLDLELTVATEWAPSDAARSIDRIVVRNVSDRPVSAQIVASVVDFAAPATPPTVWTVSLEPGAAAESSDVRLHWVPSSSQWN